MPELKSVGPSIALEYWDCQESCQYILQRLVVKCGDISLVWARFSGSVVQGMGLVNSPYLRCEIIDREGLIAKD